MHCSSSTTDHHIVSRHVFRLGEGFWDMRLRLVALAAAALLATPGVAAADNVGGGWSDVINWPLIPLHTVLLPDGRVLSYGSNSDGTQTGCFIYDLWIREQGADRLASDAAQPDRDRPVLQRAVRPAAERRRRPVRRRQLDRLATTNIGNNNSHRFQAADSDTLTRGEHEPAALVRHRDHAAERRDLHPGRAKAPGSPTGPRSATRRGNFRLLGGVDTSTCTGGTRATGWRRTAGSSAFPTAPCTMSILPGAGTLTEVGTMPPRPSGVTSSEVDVRAGPDPARRRRRQRHSATDG